MLKYKMFKRASVRYNSIQWPIARSAGAPAANRTFFCEYNGQWCYAHNFRRAGFQAAADDCAMQGGSLVQYSSAAQQLLVEQVGVAESRL